MGDAKDGNEIDEKVGKKRLLSEEFDYAEIKKVKTDKIQKKNVSSDSEEACKEDETIKIFEDVQETSCLASQKNFLDLSEDVLLILFSYVVHNDLINLAKTCTRLDRVVRDWTIWKKIKTTKNSITMNRLIDFCPFLLTCTEDIQLSFEDKIICVGESSDMPENPSAILAFSTFLTNLRSTCTNLQALSLEYVFIDAEKFPISVFPESLKKFSLKHSKLVNLSVNSSYFLGFDLHFKSIEVIDLSWCDWFSSHSLIALSKSKTLEELYLQGCRKLKNCVPYTSLSVRFGFKTLKILDLRYTLINDSEVTILYDLPCLTQLYLASPSPRQADECLISDRSITMLCSTFRRPDLVPHGGVVVRFDPEVGDILLLQNGIAHNKKIKAFHTLVVTGYPSITDITLRHAADCLSGLKYLDIRGTSCTEAAIEQFRLKRPDVTLVSGPDPERPEHLSQDPPSPIPLLPDIRVVLQRIEEERPAQRVGQPGRVVFINDLQGHRLFIAPDVNDNNLNDNNNDAQNEDRGVEE